MTTPHAAAPPPRAVMALYRPHLPSPTRPLLPFPPSLNPNLRRRLPLLCFPRRARLGPRIAASAPAASPVQPDSTDILERCFSMSPDSGIPSCSAAAAAPVMKGGKYGAFGATTLEKSKLDLSQKTTRTSPEVQGIHF